MRSELYREIKGDFHKKPLSFLSQSLLIKLIHYRIGQRWVASGRESIFAWVENWLRDKKVSGGKWVLFPMESQGIRDWD